jgi:DNA-directed RNA polymerase subunit M/transcription elongation factor TFIIS
MANTTGNETKFIDKINQMYKSLEKLTMNDVVQIRKRGLKRFISIVDRELMNKDVFNKLRKVEEYIYSSNLKYKNEHDPFGMRYYIHNFNDVYVNLNPNSYVGNKTLMKRLISDDITPEKIVIGDDKDLFEERWKTLRDEHKRLIEHNSEALKNVPTTDIYKCFKCGNRKCTYVEQQIRSLDEPHTIFVRCMNPVCGNTWKI